MSDNKGMIMTYLDKSGKEQKCEMRYADQKMCHGNTEKAFIRLVNNDGTPIMEQGNQVNKIVQFSKLTRIGFID